MIDMDMLVFETTSNKANEILKHLGMRVNSREMNPYDSRIDSFHLMEYYHPTSETQAWEQYYEAFTVFIHKSIRSMVKTISEGGRNPDLHPELLSQFQRQMMEQVKMAAYGYAGYRPTMQPKPTKTRITAPARYQVPCAVFRLSVTLMDLQDEDKTVSFMPSFESWTATRIPIRNLRKGQTPGDVTFFQNKPIYRWIDYYKEKKGPVLQERETRFSRLLIARDERLGYKD